MKNLDINHLRENYKVNSIDFNNICQDPIVMFLDWFNNELSRGYKEVNACVLSTVGLDQMPASRVVLLKYIKAVSFVFFTNYKSEKAKDIHNNNKVALNFFWFKSERQVRISGLAKKISATDSDKYFKKRPRESQIGASISQQSNIIDFDYDFSNEIEKINTEFLDKEIIRPKHWGGYGIIPSKIEFWQGRPSRLHDRLVYTNLNNEWQINRLSS